MLCTKNQKISNYRSKNDHLNDSRNDFLNSTYTQKIQNNFWIGLKVNVPMNST